MSEVLLALVAGFVVIAAATVLGRRLGVASPLLLIAVGIAASFVPAVSGVRIDPEWILQGLLPPLLYSAAVSMPTMNFRRDFSAISGLSVLLVIISAVLMGVFFSLVVPDLGFAWGVALGAIVSPTDAVATSIVKQAPISKRVVAILDGESLLNDATALVLLRTSIAAVGAGFAFWGTLGLFAYAAAVAVIIGWLVGWLNLELRKRISDPAVNTVISFAVPFAASVPAGLLQASGLVAAVTAGLVTGVLAAHQLSPRNRLSDSQNWRTIELVLEGAVFLIMGIQLRSIVTEVHDDHAGVGPAVLVAAAALLVVIIIRAAYIGPLLGFLSWRGKRFGALQDRLHDMQEKLSTPEGTQEAFGEVNPRRRRPSTERDLEFFALRITRAVADIEYLLREPLGRKEGAIVVWAGMRGAVTVAAAQTLPDDAPQRSTLVLIAFTVAALSLVLQGGTIGALVRRLQPRKPDPERQAQLEDERDRLMHLLRAEAEKIPQPEDDPDSPRLERFARHKDWRLAVLGAQRSALLDARNKGTFDAEVLADMLANLDADQIALELRASSAGV